MFLYRVVFTTTNDRQKSKGKRAASAEFLAPKQTKFKNTTVTSTTTNNKRSKLVKDNKTLLPKLTVQYKLVSDGLNLQKALSPLYIAKAYGLDCETTGLDPHTAKLRLIQIAIPNQPVIIVDLAAIPASQLQPLKKLLTGGATKILHNGKFDLSFLIIAGFVPSGPYFDTYLASRVLSAGLKKSHDLSALAERFLDIKLDKTEQLSDFSRELSESQLEYAARDAAVLLPLRSALQVALKRTKLLPTARLEFKTLPAIAQMELNGMQLCNESKLAAVKFNLEAKKQACLNQLKVLKVPSKQLSLLPDITDCANPNSPSQVKEALAALGITINSTSKADLIPISDNPLIRTLLDYRQLSKIISTFVESLPKHVNPTTGRIHPNYQQCGARSGRFSCRQPNLQNVPRDQAIRSCIVAAPGYKLVRADYSQIELRIVAYLSGDRRMIRAYKRGEDLHALTAALIISKPVEAVTPDERRLAKEINFGLIYGMGATKLKLTCETRIRPGVITLKEARLFRKRFFQGYSGVAQWQSLIQQTVYSSKIKEIRTIGGRRRRWANKPRLSELLNHPVQGSSADITKLAIAMLEVNKALKRTGALLVCMVHDEIVLECLEQTAEVAGQILKQVMVKAAKTYLKNFPVDVEVKISDTWAD